MNPVVLIATHNRISITSKCIESLMMQSVQPKIVLVSTKESEYRYYCKHYPNIVNHQCSNTPLGAKWQEGVNIARHHLPDPLIICGSDDILGGNFVENACAIVKSGVEFIGLNRWHVYSNKVLYTYDYNASIPLGGGRCYSAKALQELNYKLFDVARDKHLDDHGWRMVNSSTMPRLIVRDVLQEGLNVVSIKGNWQMMNPFNKFEGNRNVTLVSTSRDVNDLKILIDYEA